jgi:hypothetical protein
MLIEPARGSLQQLKLHITVPVITTSRPWIDHVPSPGPSQELGIGAVFRLLSDIDCPHLCDLDVVSPFNGVLTQNDEEALVQLIHARALRTLTIAPSPAEIHSSLMGETVTLSNQYDRFFRLAASSPQSMRHLQTLRLMIYSQTALDFLMHLTFLLTRFVLEHRVLNAPELETLTHALRTGSQTLHSLHVEVNRLTPPELKTILDTLPCLRRLDIDAKQLSGRTPRYASLFSVRSELSSPVVLLSTIQPWRVPSELAEMAADDFVAEVKKQTHPDCALQHLAVHVPGTVAAVAQDRLRATALAALKTAMPALLEVDISFSKTFNFLADDNEA